MDPVHVTDAEIMENTIWSTNRLYLRLLETFPKYVEDFQAKWNAWQQAISVQEFGNPPYRHSCHPSIPSANLSFRQTAHQPGPRPFLHGPDRPRPQNHPSRRLPAGAQ